MKELENIGNTKLPTNLENPFKKDHIEDIYVSTFKSFFPPYEWSSIGKVKFKTGNTSAEQKFEGKSFDEVVLKIKAFIETELS